MRRVQASQRFVGAVVAIALSAVALAACGSEEDGPGGGEGKTLVIETSFNLKTADPGRGYEITGNMIDHQIYEPLLTFDGSDLTKPVPLIATSYSLSEDGRTMTLPLRDDVVFADGTKLTSADVVFTFNRVKNLKGGPAFLLDGVTASAPDPATVVLTSEDPNPALPYLMTNPALGIENSKVFKAHGADDGPDADTTDTAQAWLDENSAGSGPYALESFSTTSEVVLTANPTYWGTAQPTYTKVVIRNKTADVQKLDVQKGTAQVVLDLSPQQADGMSGNVDVHTDPSGNTFFVFTNNNPDISTITSNKDFQDAVRYGLDYDSVVDLAGEGSSRTAGVIPSLFLGALADDQAVQTDLDKAKAALAASGYAGQEIEMELPTDLTLNGISFPTIAQRVQAQLKEVGINLTLKPGPVATTLTNYRDGKEQMGLWVWVPDYPDPSDYLVFLPGQTVGLRAGWPAGHQPELEALGEQAATATDDDTRSQLYQQIQEQLNVVGPYMPLFQSAHVAVTTTTVSGFAYNAIWTVELASLA